MKCELGEKYLITTDNWFIAPDGNSYRAVFGTIHAIKNDSEVLGIKTNRGSTNWYILIGNMMIAGCQMHYCVKTDSINDRPPTRSIEFEGKLYLTKEDRSNIFNADKTLGD